MIKTLFQNITPPIIWNLARKVLKSVGKPQTLTYGEDNNDTFHANILSIIQKGNIKLHLGCGTIYKEGWINIDNNSDKNIQKLDLDWDLRNSLPFPDNSVDFIFNEHFLEHLTVEEGIQAIKDFFRVLKPGGTMRIAMPDLEKQLLYILIKIGKKTTRNSLRNFD